MHRRFGCPTTILLCVLLLASLLRCPLLYRAARRASLVGVRRDLHASSVASPPLLLLFPAGCDHIQPLLPSGLRALWRARVGGRAEGEKGGWEGQQEGRGAAHRRRTHEGRSKRTKGQRPAIEGNSTDRAAHAGLIGVCVLVPNGERVRMTLPSIAHERQSETREPRTQKSQAGLELLSD